MDGPHLALWWTDVPPWPMPADGLRRLALLAKHGPHAEAFTLKRRFGPDGRAG